jgi:hypothetical protein
MAEGDAIFHVGADGELVEMRAELFESEDLLQRLVADHPALLAGAQMTPGDPRRWMLIRREMGLPARDAAGDHWSVDHLFVDQDGVPTIVEVKRSTDTRIRREIVGQMLDYAANAVVYWPVDRLRATHEASCETAGIKPDEALAHLVGPDPDADAFWARVGEHLASGRIRMVFVADRIPQELQRIVEFLNEGMSRAQVYAIELPQYVGGSQRSLVPRLVGATSAARLTAGRDGSTPSVEVLIGAGPPDLALADQHLRAWANARGFEYVDGKASRAVRARGALVVTLYARFNSVELYLASARTAGLTEQADSLLAELQRYSPSKSLTTKQPNLPTSDLATRWPEFISVLDRYMALFDASATST